jgi:hypothetical protein
MEVLGTNIQHLVSAPASSSPGTAPESSLLKCSSSCSEPLSPPPTHNFHFIGCIAQQHEGGGCHLCMQAGKWHDTATKCTSPLAHVLVVRALWSCQWCARESVTPASGHFVVGYSAPIKACAHPRASSVPCSWGMGVVYNKHGQAAASRGQLRKVDKCLKPGSRWPGSRRLPATRLTWLAYPQLVQILCFPSNPTHS